MKTLKRLSQIFQSSVEIVFDSTSRIILMSDCHRGDGSWADDFAKNQNIYFAALTHYYKENYTYIEIGDGDELWENKNFDHISLAHKDAFELLSKFYSQDRLYFIYGNHDMEKKHREFSMPLFPNIKFHEGLILNYQETKDKIFLTHGHQVDFFNYNLWKLSKILVRYFWKPLELLGIQDPTSTAMNYNKKESVEKKLTEWVIKENQMLIAGHTHRPMFPKVGDPLYFNDGSCVHPRGITGIEIVEGDILLVKWSVKTREDATLYVEKEVLAGPQKLENYFINSNKKPLHFIKNISIRARVEM